MTIDLLPNPGFDWARVKWGAPTDRVSDVCSYCGAPIPDEDTPLRLWNDDGRAAVFCMGCMKTWWGMELADDDDDSVSDDDDDGL